LSKLDGSPLADPVLYRKIVGTLQYATITRLDLIFVVNKVSQFVAQPTETHRLVVKRILCYIQGILDHRLQLTIPYDLSITTFCDVDWTCCPDDRRSTTEFAVFLGSNIISWSSKK
jgi:hypothetical protein